MQQNHFLFTIFSLIGASHCLFLIAFLGRDYKNLTLSNKIFLGILFVYAVRMTKWIGLYLPSSLFIPYNNFCYSLQAILGPLIYFYTLSFTNESFAFRRKHVIYLAPLLILQFLAVNEEYAKWMQVMEAVVPCIALYWIIFIGLAIRMVLKNKLWLETADNFDKNWIGSFLLGNFFLAISYIIYLQFEENGQNLFAIAFMIVSILSSLLYLHFQYDKPKTIVRNKKFNPDIAVRLARDIDDLIDQKVFLDPELTMPKMAEMLNISTHMLSQNINNYYGQNFSDFINSHRLKYAARKLENSSELHVKIAVIAYESGFNSLSSFNSIFKKTYKITPSQYRAEAKSNIHLS
jgi:AraC-like DNA-binding protein